MSKKSGRHNSAKKKSSRGRRNRPKRTNRNSSNDVLRGNPSKPSNQVMATQRGATPRVSKHRVFVWVKADVVCNDATDVFARDDDYTFGVLHSRIYETWAKAMGTQLREAESGFRYTPTSCFETFPLTRPTDEQREEIAGGARCG